MEYIGKHCQHVIFTFRNTFPSCKGRQRAEHLMRRNLSLQSHVLFSLKFQQNSSLSPHPTFLSPVPLGPSLYFSFLCHTPSFSRLLYASPLVTMGTRVGSGSCSYDLSDWWNFVTFLTDSLRICFFLFCSFCELECKDYDMCAF